MDFILNNYIFLYIQKLSGVFYSVSVFYAYACPAVWGIAGERNNLRSP